MDFFYECPVSFDDIEQIGRKMGDRGKPTPTMALGDGCDAG